jgi:hypothetical protein
MSIFLSEDRHLQPGVSPDEKAALLDGFPATMFMGDEEPIRHVTPAAKLVIRRHYPMPAPGFMAGTLEPEETLGDTAPMPLDDDDMPDFRGIEARNLRRMYALVAVVILCWYFGWIA